MRDIFGNEVYKPDHTYNKAVVEAIAGARQAKDERQLIDWISGGKEWETIKEYSERDTEEELEIEIEL